MTLDRLDGVQLPADPTGNSNTGFKFTHCNVLYLAWYFCRLLYAWQKKC